MNWIFHRPEDSQREIFKGKILKPQGIWAII
jgi:hypothetical protein